MQTISYFNFLRLKRLLPSALRAWAEKRYWSSFWKGEQHEDDGSVDGSERPSFVESLIRFYPFSDILELGCGYGQNFVSLTKLFPEVSFVGLDINPARIRAAEEIQKQQYPRSKVQFIAADAINLSRFESGSFDCVLTSGFLLYVSASRIVPMIREMRRVARKAIIMLEQHVENPAYRDQHLGVFVPQNGSIPAYWVRDYGKLLAEVFPAGDISVEILRIPMPRWTTEQWGSLGRVITVRIEKQHHESSALNLQHVDPQATFEGLD